MGRDGGGLVGGSDLCYRAMLGLRQDAIDLLAENDSAFRLTQDAVVFMMHQGYQWARTIVIYSIRRPDMARAMTSCWISEVPSKIVWIFASRCQRSTGYSRV